MLRPPPAPCGCVLPSGYANHLSNTARISEYNRLEAKVDALAEAVGGEFVVVWEGEK